jgi:anti-sigma28 factor (negative regulator of flagellin synthesis)
MMKVDLNALNLTQSLQQTAPANPEALKGKGDQPLAADGDQVQISDLASQLAAQASAADPERLAQLQASFEAGSYNVRPDQIAASIIRDLTN